MSRGGKGCENWALIDYTVSVITVCTICIIMQGKRFTCGGMNRDIGLNW